jgi:hypothetical protein
MTRYRPTLLAIFGIFLARAGSTYAQITPPPVDGATTSAGSSSSGGLAVGAFGIGAQTMLASGSSYSSAIPALSASYELGRMHIEGLFSLNYTEASSSTSRTDLGIGGRAWFHLRQSANTDFSLGGGLGILHVSMKDNGQTYINLNGGFLVRAFLFPNFALTGTGGLAFVTGDYDSFAVNGQLLGSLGFMYYF